MEINRNKYKLAICEIFNPTLHGYDRHSDPSILSQFIIFEMIDIDEFYNNGFKDYILHLATTYSRFQESHPVIENYKNIVANSKNHNIDIIQQDILSGEEMVAYKKTFWLRIFQKKWKKNYYKKINFYKNPKNLFSRQLHGRKK